MNRREFLHRFGIGVAAACALASLPVAAVDTLTVIEAGKLCACEYMRRLYNDWCKAHPGQRPQRLEAGYELFEAYEGELTACARFVAEGPDRAWVALNFKGTPLIPVGTGWTMRVAA